MRSEYALGSLHHGKKRDQTGPGAGPQGANLMNRLHRRIGWSLALTILLGTFALPLQADTPEPPITHPQTKDDFAAVAAAIQQQMGKGGHYEYINPSERAEVSRKLGDMQSIFDKYGSVAQMDTPAKTQLFSDQEKINSILTHNDSRRVVCQREMPTGSHLPKTVCRTFGQMMQDRTNARDMMDNINQLNRGQTKGGG